MRNRAKVIPHSRNERLRLALPLREACDLLWFYPCEIGYLHGNLRELTMSWTTPVMTEECVGMEVTSYASAKV